jgi:GMP synthase (glutamine-hydrolysing)
MIYIIDFGSQTTHLISRRISDFGIKTKIIDPEKALFEIKKKFPDGIIFSGGPASVYEKNAPTISRQIFNFGIPILGICYGWQLIAYLLGGEVKEGHKEYGPVDLSISDFSNIFYGIPNPNPVYQSHGDSVIKSPKGFEIIASTQSVKFAAVTNSKNKIIGVQFHPEMQHTQNGNQILENFITRVCNLPITSSKINVDQIIKGIKEKVGEKEVIGAFSGGTDSAVAGVLVAKAIGKNFIPIYIDSGLMREDNLERIKQDFPKILGTKIKIINARKEFLEVLKGVSDPEEKRKKIGGLYIKLFENEIKKNKKAKYLLQGTTYADFIHSQGSKRSAHIKSHHNVGGLPKKMRFKLLEPLRFYYTDQVRKIGIDAGLPKKMVFQQPFPGPGFAVRIMGEVNAQRLLMVINADKIVVEELKNAKLYDKIFQCWAVMTGINSTAVKGDSRFYGEVVAIRIVNSTDRMTASFAKIPYIVLEKISTRIVNEVPEVSRVVYDITSKPPATMEWE